MELVIASHNLHKVREFRDILKNLENIDVLSLHNFPNYHLPEETGKTFEENATLKALDAAKNLNKWVLADDSGLVVPSLDGKPGIFSRRYAGEDATDADNRNKLLKEMNKMTDLERAAYYECAIALASPKGIEKTSRGICEGSLLLVERGSHGFGYDPIFLKNDYDKSFGELDESIKNRVSHRYKAVEKLTPILESLK